MTCSCLDSRATIALKQLTAPSSSRGRPAHNIGLRVTKHWYCSDALPLRAVCMCWRRWSDVSYCCHSCRAPISFAQSSLASSYTILRHVKRNFDPDRLARPARRQSRPCSLQPTLPHSPPCAERATSCPALVDSGEMARPQLDARIETVKLGE